MVEPLTPPDSQPPYLSPELICSAVWVQGDPFLELEPGDELFRPERAVPDSRAQRLLIRQGQSERFWKAEWVVTRMKIQDLTLNWFDLVVLIVMAVGAFRGRSRGMSLELLDVVKWLMIVAVGGLVYQPAGQFISGYTHFSVLSGYVVAYLAVILFVRFFFSWARRMLGEKLIGSDVFGGGEYYLGMIAGAVRFTCVVVVVLAFLNAKYITPEQLAAERKMQNDNFGDISFPTLGSMQQTVFIGSASGRFTKKYLVHELIVTREADCRTASANTIGRQRERAVYEALGEKP